MDAHPKLVLQQGQIQNFVKGVLVNGNGIYCAQHNEHVKHANARGVWGHASPGKFEKLDTQIVNLVGFEHKCLTYI